MLSLRIILVNAVALLAITGCSSSKMTGPTTSADLASEPLHPGKARICVMRISSGLSLASGKVKDGDRMIGALRQNRYLCWEREPGNTVIRSSWVPLLKVIEENDDVYELPLTVKAGEVHYLMQQWRMTKPSTRLVVLDEEYAKEKLAECRPTATAED